MGLERKFIDFPQVTGGLVGNATAWQSGKAEEVQIPSEKFIIFRPKIFSIPAELAPHEYIWVFENFYLNLTHQAPVE